MLTTPPSLDRTKQKKNASLCDVNLCDVNLRDVKLCDVSVCVDHLKRCKTSHRNIFRLPSSTTWMIDVLPFFVPGFSNISRGHAAITQTHANEAMCDGGSRD